MDTHNRRETEETPARAESESSTADRPLPPGDSGRAVEARFDALLEAAVDAIIVIGDDGHIQTFSPAAERMFGYGVAEILGENVSVLMPEPFRSEHDNYIRNYLDSGVARIIGIGREVQALKKDGTVFPIDLSVGHARIAGKDAFVGIIRDLTAHKAAEAAFHQSRREADGLREDLAHVDRLGMMGEMATGIAHEINQPLTAIGNYAQACRFILQRESVDQELVLETMDKISRGAKRAGEVIRRLRTFVDKRESKRERVAVNDLVGKVAALLENEVRLHDLEIRMELAQSIRPVVADPVQIQQVLLNLLRNGIDAMEGLETSENRILIETIARAQSEVEVTVTDHGVGVSEDASEKLFHPFFTTKESGMGIGLSICHSIVDAHGGRLWFTRNPEEGTTFHFTLPTAIEASGRRR